MLLCGRCDGCEFDSEAIHRAMLKHLDSTVSTTDNRGDLDALETGEPELDHPSLIVSQLRHRASERGLFVVAEHVLFGGWSTVGDLIGDVQVGYCS